MKITQQLEWDYAKIVNYKSMSHFMAREKIKDFAAEAMFIPIIEELYDKNIFTSWSGLTGDAHIRILDTPIFYFFTRKLKV